ncbi:carboxymuconolactone decarboxylase family protein [Thiohalophilus sp.]|uniref:carboxymuconolactone decarboxylase family protein n=1 Tax=Thiohalophilus sp. TaxID=3028392 RepID=UPI002ACDA9B5|nr:carboxymuconolactone decarboxylase family protein [Thiohalophilus sp.]MDZ7663008.1 carboxymuconolactone decarboxylase family protein [Thiohalophilus sp.]
MSDLTTRESELVALGAALGSNCVPCIEYHIPQARKVGLTDQEIHSAIQLADKVRQVPANKVLEAARSLLPPATDNQNASSNESEAPDASGGCGCS